MAITFPPSQLLCFLSKSRHSLSHYIFPFLSLRSFHPFLLLTITHHRSSQSIQILWSLLATGNYNNSASHLAYSGSSPYAKYPYLLFTKASASSPTLQTLSQTLSPPSLWLNTIPPPQSKAYLHSEPTHPNPLQPCSKSLKLECMIHRQT